MGFRGRILGLSALIAIGRPATASADQSADQPGVVELSPAGFDAGARRYLPLAPRVDPPEKFDRYRVIAAAIGLDVPWRYSAADVPRFADPAFDDQSWETASTILSDWPKDRPFG